MPEVKIDPTALKKSLRVLPSPQNAAKQFDVDISTIYRFIKEEGIDIYFLKAAGKQGTYSVAKTLKDIGCSHSTIAKKLAVTPQYISQVILQKNIESRPWNHE